MLEKPYQSQLGLLHETSLHRYHASLGWQHCFQFAAKQGVGTIAKQHAPFQVGQKEKRSGSTR
jgi:hypothetical protein